MRTVTYAITTEELINGDTRCEVTRIIRTENDCRFHRCVQLTATGKNEAIVKAVWRVRFGRHNGLFA